MVRFTHYIPRMNCIPLIGYRISKSLVATRSLLSGRRDKTEGNYLMPTLTINGDRQSLPDPSTVADMIQRLGYDRKRVAVEVNQSVIPAAEHMSQKLAEGDAV